MKLASSLLRMLGAMLPESQRASKLRKAADEDDNRIKKRSFRGKGGTAVLPGQVNKEILQAGINESAIVKAVPLFKDAVRRRSFYRHVSIINVGVLPITMKKVESPSMNIVVPDLIDLVIEMDLGHMEMTDWAWVMESPMKNLPEWCKDIFSADTWNTMVFYRGRQATEMVYKMNMRLPRNGRKQVLVQSYVSLPLHFRDPIDDGNGEARFALKGIWLPKQDLQ